jgi:hypothetical protein
MAANNGTPMAGSMITVTISVGAAVNRPPVLAPIGDRDVPVGAPLAITLSATDPDQDAVAFDVIPLPAGASLVGAEFSWTPVATDTGNHRLTFSATDDGVPPQTASESVLITVGAVNRPPNIVPIGDRVVKIGDTARIEVIASDPDGDALTTMCSGLPRDALFEPLPNGQAVITWAPTAVAAYAVVCTTVDDGAPPEMAIAAFSLRSEEAAPPPPPAAGPVIESARWEPEDRGGKLVLRGTVPRELFARESSRDRERDEDEDDDEDEGEDERDEDEREIALRAYAILEAGEAVEIGRDETDEDDGAFEMELEPFIAPCRVAVSAGGVLGAAVPVQGAPQSCGSEVMVEVRRARWSCRKGLLRVRGSNAPLGGTVQLEDAASGAVLGTVPVRNKRGRFRHRGPADTRPESLRVRVTTDAGSWTLDEVIPVRSDKSCRDEE